MLSYSHMLVLKPNLRVLDDVQRKCVQQFISDMYTADMLSALFNTPADPKSSMFAAEYVIENPSALFEYFTGSKCLPVHPGNAYSNLDILATSDNIPYATWRKRDLYAVSIKVIRHTKEYNSNRIYGNTVVDNETIETIGVYPATSAGIAAMITSTDYVYHIATKVNSLPIDTVDNPWVLLTYPKFYTPTERVPPMYVWFAKYNVLLSLCKTYDSEFQVSTITISSCTQDHTVMTDDDDFDYVVDRSSVASITDVFNSTDPEIYDVYRIRNRGANDMLTTRQMFTPRIYKVAQINTDLMISNQTDPYTHGTPEGGAPLEFLCGTEEKLEELIKTIVYAHIPYRVWNDCQVSKLPITVRAATDQDSVKPLGAEVTFCEWLDEVNSMFEDKHIPSAMQAQMNNALDAALDQNYPVGFSWEYNDGVSNKMSGYSEEPHTIKLEIPAPSAHDYMGSILEFNKWAEVSLGKSALLHTNNNDITDTNTNVQNITEHHG